jgi:hypothetical protein
MSRLTWIQTSLRGRSWWLVGGGIVLVASLAVAVVSRGHWHDRAANLQRENLNLQLSQLAHEMARQSNQLADRAREIAESEAAIRLVQDNTDASADRLELGEMARGGADTVLVLNASHGVRYSVTFANGQLNEQSSDPSLVQFVESINLLESANRTSQVAVFADDRWIVTRPIIGHSAAASLLGWVVVSRSLSPALIASLANSV